MMYINIFHDIHTTCCKKFIAIGLSIIVLNDNFDNNSFYNLYKRYESCFIW
jgi:hypothetical protein